uniref:Peptidase S1 domain-containing protein n=1 Tax=Clastoptera arizonana TaxID=38151 RepID=A0A1B6BXU4_9HEMI
MMILILVQFLTILQLSVAEPLQDDGSGLLDLNYLNVLNYSSYTEQLKINRENDYYQNLFKINTDIDDDLSLIVKGNTARRGQLPYQVALLCMVQPRYGFLCCGGSLISTKYVLTAAHCVDNLSKYVGLAVTLGGVDLSRSEANRLTVKVSLSDIKIHEKYSSTLYNDDIALIKLPYNIEPTTYYSVVDLPTYYEGMNPSAAVGRTATVSGWGRTTDSSDKSSKVLQYGYMTVISNAACASSYQAAKYRITSSQLCAAVTYDANICNGDSGGPLVVSNKRNVLMGVVSIGASKCELGFPSAFTRVSYYLDWIARNSDIAIDWI